MKLDWDIMREILLAIEATGPDESLSSEDFADLEAKRVAYHMRLMNEANLIVIATGPGRGDYVVERLTWRGHELLEKIRSNHLWAVLSRLQRERDFPLTLDTINQAVSNFLQTQLESLSNVSNTAPIKRKANTRCR